MSEIIEVLERYADGPRLIASALAGASADVERFRPAPDRWNICEILAHLADSETEAALRFRFILTEDHPSLSAADQSVWAYRLNYSALDPQQSLELFRHLRRQNYELLKDLTADAFARTGNHPKRGTVTLLDLLTLYARHAEKHADQIRAVRRAFEDRPN